jgi:hypothetical protein
MKVAKATPAKSTKAKRTGFHDLRSVHAARRTELHGLRGFYAEVMAVAVSSAATPVPCATTGYSFSNTLNRTTPHTRPRQMRIKTTHQARKTKGKRMMTATRARMGTRKRKRAVGPSQTMKEKAKAKD